MVIPCFMQDLTSKFGVAPVSCVQKPCEMRLVSCPLPQGISCRLPDFVVGKLALESACALRFRVPGTTKVMPQNEAACIPLSSPYGVLQFAQFARAGCMRQKEGKKIAIALGFPPHFRYLYL